MGSLNLFRLFLFPIRRMSVSRTKLDENQKVQERHIYKKTYTPEELIQYVLDSTVYNSEDYIVSSVPQGCCFKASKKWGGAEKSYACNVPVDDLLPVLRKKYNAKILVMSKSPQRNASGLLILSKSYQAHDEISGGMAYAMGNMIRIFTHLALVVGVPKKNVLKTFSVSKELKGEEYITKIFETGIELADDRKTKYKHEILQTTGQVSLLKISTSYDFRDCIRNILCQSCFTPVFGDFWSINRAVNFLFGAPLVQDVQTVKPKLYELSPDLLGKLHLTKKEQKIIPIHLHSYSMTLKMSKDRTFFCSVPPPSFFIWTCEKLGLNKIRRFTKTPLEVSGWT